MSSAPRQVVTAIAGGLGNQMFQYAAARRLAHINEAELLLYLGDRYGKGAFRPYGLDRFNICGRIAGPGEAGGLRKVNRTRRRLAKIFPSLAAVPDSELYREASLAFDPAVLDLRGNIKLTGYWQSERYFADIAESIREEFTLRDGLDARNSEALARIESGPSAFIHVRRGDYVSHPIDSKKFGTCSPAYYSEAVQILRSRIGPQLRFFVFSDEPDWVREMKIGGEGAEIVDWNGDRPERDLVLMQRCKHAVIANSSFSWWGAWLGDGAERVVIAPSVWYQGHQNSYDILPDRWLKL